MIPLKDDNPTRNKPIVTYCVIGICVFVFLLQLSSEGYRSGSLFYSYGLIPTVLLGSQSLPVELYVLPAGMTLFTSMFMHGGLMHLLGNMLYMWIFADNVEDELGPVKFTIFYLVCGVAAAMTQVMTDTDSAIPMIGASGAIGGVLGAYVVRHPRARVLVLIPLGFYSQLVKIPAIFVLGFWFVLQLINSRMSASAGGVAYGAHVGGFIAGALLILPFGGNLQRIMARR